MSYRMALISVTLSDLESRFLLQFFKEERIHMHSAYTFNVL